LSRVLEFDAATSRRMDALYRTPDAIRRRSRVLDLLEPRSGERILDVGCGPGFLASEIGAAVGSTGRVEAIDRSDAMLALASDRCAAQPWIEVGAGDAERLDLGDRTFDAVVSVQVHEYVRDVAGSLAILGRHLRPGGRLLVVATDWDSIVWSARDRERAGRILSAFEEHLADLHLPCRLGPLLAQAGLAVRRLEPIVQLNPVWDPNTFSHGLAELIRNFVPGRRGVTQADADAWAAELRELGARGEYFFSLNQYAFLAFKP
jgi:SAM-dependent methyltransferase